MFTRQGQGHSFGLLRVWIDLAIALALLIAVGTYLSLNEGNGTGLLLVLGSALASLGYLVGCATAIAVWSARRRWARAAASATKALTFVFLVGPCLRAGDYVHLALFYPVYRQAIEAQNGVADGPIRFDWGDKALWVTDGLQADTLVYDPTDALAAFIGEVRDANQTGLGLATRHLIGHFYVEREFSR